MQEQKQIENKKDIKQFIETIINENEGFISAEVKGDKLYIYVDNLELCGSVKKPFKEVFGIDVICARRTRKR